MPNDYPKKPVLRAPTLKERAGDFLRNAFGSVAEQPLGQISDALGITDFTGLSKPADPNELTFGAMPGPPVVKNLAPVLRGKFGQIKASQPFVKSPLKETVTNIDPEERLLMQLENERDPEVALDNFRRYFEDSKIAKDPDEFERLGFLRDVAQDRYQSLTGKRLRIDPKSEMYDWDFITPKKK